MSARPSDTTGGGRGPTVTQLIAGGTLDAELAALLWLLLSGDLPLVVSGAPGAGRDELALALEELAAVDGRSNGGTGRPLWLLEEDSLQAVFDRLAGPPTGLGPDQLRATGLVLIVRRVAGRGSRLVAAHYVRPVERDAAGHIQRRPPALLAAWDESEDRLEHYAWGVTSELAERLGMDAPDFEDAQAARHQLLSRLVETGAHDRQALLGAVGEFRQAERH